MVAHHREGGDHLHRYLKTEKWAGSVVELALSASGVSSGKRSVAEIGLKVCRKESMAYVLGLGVGGVRPVVDGGGVDSLEKDMKCNWNWTVVIIGVAWDEKESGVFRRKH